MRAACPHRVTDSLSGSRRAPRGAGRGALLTAAYCAGLGLPFIATGLAFRLAMGAFAALRKHSRLITRFGGALLIVVGLLLVTGVLAGMVLLLIPL